MTSYDVVIVGAGPAGMAAAIAARKSGATVAVIDDNHSAGGQIWRGGGPAELFRKFKDSGAEFVCGSRVIDGSAGEKWVRTEDLRIGYGKLVLATGARELFIPFPGWTLPNVFGVGGLQALVKAGLAVDGKRIIVAGSGPLLMAVAAHLVEQGASVPLIGEQAPWRNLRGFGRSVILQPGKVWQGLQMGRSLLRTKYTANCWVTGAFGDKRVEEVSLVSNGIERREKCDYLAVSYGLVSNTELAELLGCEVADGRVRVNAQQQTSVDSIYCAGEPTGIGGVDESLLEGEIAGHAATGRDLRRSRSRTDRFSKALNKAFVLRPELAAAVTGETIICRCEDVPFEQVKKASGWREAKLHHRCGMGPCQGRVCGPAVHHLLGWKPESVRPPLFPTKIQNLMKTEEITHK